ncbi:hypothetical protein BaRGS_00009333 [Batillaria attramentaria]|uniref:Uncharacterized protein n=1 Tax=Batillaria attramentaria TaxID=370345 RepID=A0ABD0LIW3_9CAEN
MLDVGTFSTYCSWRSLPHYLVTGFLTDPLPHTSEKTQSWSLQAKQKGHFNYSPVASPHISGHQSQERITDFLVAVSHLPAWAKTSPATTHRFPERQPTLKAPPIGP